MLKQVLALAAVVGVLVAAPAFAFQCPMDMKKIDEALNTAQLSEADRAEVTKLRAEGEAFHQAGKHDESVATLAKAKALLGIE
ncbi:MAG: hypothetical protein AB7P52_03060 [Alphaproteobacteria bacterium]